MEMHKVRKEIILENYYQSHITRAVNELLHRKDGLSITEMVPIIGFSRKSILNSLNELIEDGVIRRIRDFGDARVRRYYRIRGN